MIQILTGVFLAIHFSANRGISFDTVRHISRDVNLGWLLRILHANGARAFFICLYIHVARGLIYNSFFFIETWNLGVIILLIVIAAAFIGYVLPWGQISFWGATVITNLFSAIPYFGSEIVNWIWGGFAVDNPTLTRFFTFHFIVPILVAVLVIAHLLILHQTGSSNPLGLPLNVDKVPFHPYFSRKDFIGIIIFMIILVNLSLINPWLLGDPENFIPANPIVTPVHIQPEWYFLFAYAILRSIPNKLGGVIALAGSIIILFIMPFYKFPKIKSNLFYPVNKLILGIFFNNFLLLTWIGARPVEEPYVIAGQIFTITYFIFFFIFNITQKLWDKYVYF